MRKIFFFWCNGILGPMYYPFDTLDEALEVWKTKRGDKSPVQEGYIPDNTVYYGLGEMHDS